MILIGLLSMLLLVYWLLLPQHKGYEPLYWLLMFSLFFMILRVLHEWYHYFFIKIPETPPAKKRFSVDVFTTFCTGEPYAMIEETLKAIKAIEYPHETYLCDDAGDDYVKKLCEELDVHYITREGRKDAKAGNINNGLKHSSGELCVVLDPDHVPAPDFLDPIVPHFNNPQIGFVQIVQAYKNKHESLVAKGAAQQTFQFYGPMMMTMNTYGTVLAIGANCTFRRAALDSIGGHAPGLAEDMHTAMKLHAKGWQSTYVPAVLARGLVPSTLSGYFKQQLKWTRGTFELLISTYPRLFKHFSFRQRLHYALIPFHYFSGVIHLLNFLIPIIALLTALIPLKVDLPRLIFLSLPFLASVMLIRLYVQRWVMEEPERGFHMVGGILQIGTWWVNVIGIFYSIIRKEVPYDPTPKDGSEGHPWKLNLPNITVGLASVLAIIYGLWMDWNPYSLVMAFLAAVNCCFVLFMLIAGLQPKIRNYRSRQSYFDTAMDRVDDVKRDFWLFRHFLYKGFRKAGLPLILIIIASSFYLFKLKPETNVHNHYREHPFYTGIFQPGNSRPNLTDLKTLKDFSEQHSLDFDIVSLYLAWGDKAWNQLPMSYIDSIYSAGAVPMLTWEPWSSGFEFTRSHPQLSQENNVMQHISEGFFDEYLIQFATTLKSLKKPVFLRFAHEPDNPAYPWSTAGGNTPEEFRKAWRHVHKVFSDQDARNVIWVWNPWSPDAVENYFPGEDYIDWLGLTTLNYARYYHNKDWKSFEYIYSEFDSTGIFDYNYPVMLAEFGSLQEDGRQTDWFKEAFQNIDENYPEVRSLVFFNSGIDKNIPGKPGSSDTLDWRISQPRLIAEMFAESVKDQSKIETKPVPHIRMLGDKPGEHAKDPLQGLRGINVHKAKDWLGNYDNLAIREALHDFSEIDKLGAAAIKWYGPGVYDRNVFRSARENDLQIVFGLWIPDHLDFEKDSKRLAALEDQILSTVIKYKDQDGIIAWNFGNTNWQNLSDNYYKPRLFYQQQAYLEWLGELLPKIKAIDSSRPVFADVDFHSEVDRSMRILKYAAPAIDAFGVVVEDRDSVQEEMLDKISLPFFFSGISARKYVRLDDRSRSAFITSWQDQRTANYSSFEGLTDLDGRYKPAYFLLRNCWKGAEIPQSEFDFQIITPATPIYAEQQMKYYLAWKKAGKWDLLTSDEAENLKFEWYLVKTDTYGNPLRMQLLGKEADVLVNIPKNYRNYRLRLYVINGDRSYPLETKLNRAFIHPEFTHP